MLLSDVNDANIGSPLVASPRVPLQHLAGQHGPRMPVQVQSGAALRCRVARSGTTGRRSVHEVVIRPAPVSTSTAHAVVDARRTAQAFEVADSGKPLHVLTAALLTYWR